MADDSTKIEKSLDQIKNDVSAIDTRIDSANRDLDKIENALSDIKKHQRNIEGNTKNLAALKKGMEEVEKRLPKKDALSAIQKLAGNSGATKSLESKIENISKRQNEISGNTLKIAKSADEINGHTKDAADYLKIIKEHITNQGTGNNNVSAASASSSGEGTEGIHTTVKSILQEIKEIKTTILQKTLKTGDKELDEITAKNLRAREELQKDQLEEQLYLRGKIIDDKGKVKEGTKEELKDKERRIKERKLEEEKRSRKITTKKTATGKWTTALGNVTSFITEKPSASKLADKGINAVSQMGPTGALIGSIMALVKAAIDLGSKQDRASSDFARIVGGNVQGKSNVGTSVRKMVRTMPGGRGYSADAAFSAMTEVAEARGRSTERMSSEDIRSAIDLKRFGIGADAINNFDSFGKSLRETDKYFARLYSEVSKKGLSFKNVSKAVNDNLKMAQTHTFANGLRGLERMAEKSTQLKYNMQQVFQFADKVSELEGAISTSANLSVLGGQFAQFSNPMQMLYEGLNDTEALNDRIVSMFGNKAFWNSETGQMDMSALNREMMKQAAKAAGLDPGEMINMAFNQGKMNRVSSQIMPGISKDTAEYIKNIAELNEKGEAYVSLNGKEVKVKNLTEDDREMLEKESRAKDRGENGRLGDIWNETMSIGEKLDNLLQYLQEQLGRWVAGIFATVAKGAMKSMTIAQGTGSETLQQKRLEYYNQETKGKWLGSRKKAKQISKMSESEIDAKLDSETNMAGGSPMPSKSSVPGGYGFANGPTHWDGGMRATYGGKPVEIEKDEFLLNAQSSRKYRGMLPKMQNGTFNPYSYSNDLVKNDMKRHYEPMQVSALSREMLKQAYNAGVKNQMNSVGGTIKVDIPSTITINIAGGNKVGDYDVSGIISQYVDQFMKEAIMRKDFSGFNKEEFYNKTMSSV